MLQPGEDKIVAEEAQRMLGIPAYFSLPNDYSGLTEAYASGNLLSGVYLNYEQDTGQYVAAFGSGNKGVLMVCKSSALGEQASRSCEGPLLRMVKAWGQVLGG